MSDTNTQKVSKVETKIAIIMLLLILGVITFFLCKTGIYAFQLSQIEKHAANAGLLNIHLHTDPYAKENKKYTFNLSCDNFDKLDWDTLMEMDKNIKSVHNNMSIEYHQGSTTYKIDPDKNYIQETNFNTEKHYNGSWHSYDKVDLKAQREKQAEINNKNSEELQNIIDKKLDENINLSKCGICGKQATKRIGNEYYCAKHYSEAYDWYIEQAAEKLLEGQ